MFEMKKFSELEYKRPDMDAVKCDYTKAMDAFAAAKAYAQAKEAFFAMQKIVEDVETAFVLADVRNTMDMSNEFYNGEVAFFGEELAKLMPLQKQAGKLYLQSEFRDEFEAEFGKQLTRLTEANDKITDESIVSHLIEQDKLENEYKKIAASCKTEFHGETCNFYGLLKFMQDEDRAVRKAAFEAWAKLYQSASAQLDEVFDKLVALRVDMAKKLGLPSYIDFAYLRMNRFDYDKHDVKEFREAIRKYVVPVCDRLYKEQAAALGVDKLHYYDEAVYAEGNAIPKGTMEELVEAAGKMYDEMSPESGEFFRFMRKYQLFDLQTRPNKHLGGYCTSLGAYKAPFIFSNFNGTMEDVNVLTHEAGHAFMDYLSARRQVINQYQFSTSEVNEIHSMSMEHFAYPWMERFFGEQTKQYLHQHLVSSFCVIPYLVSVDEFQHGVYEKPDMTAQERRTLWRSIEKKYMPWRDYDGNAFLEEGGFWMQKQHIFLYPFYYIDYSLAQMNAFEFFMRSTTDRKAAWEDYVRLCKAGGSLGYFELLKLANLSIPLKEETVKKITAFVEEQLKKQ